MPGHSEPYSPDGLAPEADSPTEMELSRVEKPVLSVAWAYMYLITLGWLGVHRFYLRRWYTGVLYAVSFGFLGFGLLLDLLLLPVLTNRSNAEIDKSFKANPGKFRTWPERVAPWARNAGKFDPQVLLVGVFWLAAPPLLAMLAIMFGFPWGPVYLAVMLAVVAFAGSAQHLLQRYPNLGQIPLVSTVVFHLVELEQFYYDNKPRPLIYYLAFPIAAPISALTSKTARTEARILFWPAGVVLAGLATDFMWSYGDQFKDSIDASQALEWIFVVVLVSAMIVTMFLVPTVTTALTLNLSGRRRFTQLFATLAIILGLPCTLVAYQMFESRVTIPSAELLEARLKNEAFRATVARIGRMYLETHRPKVDAPKDLSALMVVMDEALSEEIQKIFEGFVPESEVAAFRILRLKNGSETALVLLHYDTEDDREETPDDSNICQRQPFAIAARSGIYTKVDALGALVDLPSLANKIGQGEETYLIEDWPCGADVD